MIRRRDGSLNVTAFEITPYVVVRWFGGESIRHLKAYRGCGIIFVEAGRLGFAFGKYRREAC